MPGTPRRDTQNSNVADAKFPLRELRVLLVEDLPHPEQTYLLWIRLAGAAVDLASNGRDAAAMTLAASPPYDLVIMDMVTPLLDGMVTVLELRRQGYAGAILALAPPHKEVTRKTWCYAGCNDYLTKPFSMPTLIETSRRLVESDGKELSHD